MIDNWKYYEKDFISDPIEYRRVLREEELRKLQEKLRT